jgi:hypothetical protein
VVDALRLGANDYVSKHFHLEGKLESRAVGTAPAVSGLREAAFW